MSKLGWADVASTFHVISAYDLLKFARMERHQDIRESVRWLGADQPLVLLFISHRWETLTHPDPSGRQHRAIQGVLRAICVSAEAMLVPRDERLSLIPSLEQEGYLQGEEIMRRALGFGPFARDAQRVDGKDPKVILQTEFSARKHHPGAFRDWLAQRIGIWLDYTCVPQEPRSTKEDVEVRQTLLKLDALIESSTLVALREDRDDYTERGWCASEFFLGSARSFTKALFVDIDRLTNARSVADPGPIPWSPDTLTAKVMVESYEADRTAWQSGLHQWTLPEGPLIREHIPELWAPYRALQGSVFPSVAVDPNPFRRVLDAISSMETSLVQNWLMSDRPRTFDLGRAVQRLMQQHGLRCAKNSDLIYLGFVIVSNGWVDAFRPLLRECLRRYLRTVRRSADHPDAWPALVVTLNPVEEDLRKLFLAVRPSSAGTWYSRLRSSGLNDRHEMNVIVQVRASLQKEPPRFAFAGPTGKQFRDDIEDLQ